MMSNRLTLLTFRQQESTEMRACAGWRDPVFGAKLTVMSAALADLSAWTRLEPTLWTCRWMAVGGFDPGLRGCVGNRLSDPRRHIRPETQEAGHGATRLPDGPDRRPMGSA